MCWLLEKLVKILFPLKFALITTLHLLVLPVEQTKPATHHLHTRRHGCCLLSALLSPGPSKVERPQDLERTGWKSGGQKKKKISMW